MPPTPLLPLPTTTLTSPPRPLVALPVPITIDPLLPDAALPVLTVTVPEETDEAVTTETVPEAALTLGPEAITMLPPVPWPVAWPARRLSEPGCPATAAPADSKI